ncbi:MAG: protein kinase domain-containing protein, partial [Pyrinomonadaceae bacterium]
HDSMTPERYRQIGELYHAALELDPDERSSFLEQACAGDAALKSEVESLIASHEQASDFINEPALAVAAEMLADEQATELIGHTIARYHVLSLVGAGGMGRVYLAEDTALGRRVALKLLPEHFTNNKDQVLRFRQEARAASALNHPGILTVYEVGRVNGTEFIATEYVEGETLRSRLARGPFGVSEALDVATQVAEALVAAHEAGIIHRDIKPENVMIRRDGYVKILDFGLAKLTENLSTLRPSEFETPTRPAIKTNPGVVMGTAEYMSPEQARGLPVDGRTDVWSLGVVVYEMLTGRRPFSGPTHGDTIVSILEREPTPLLHQGPEVPPELDRIVTKALTKNTDERYQTVKEMALDLRRLRRRLEAAAEIHGSAQPVSSSEAKTVIHDTGRGAVLGTKLQSAHRVSETEVARTTSSLEYLVSEISRHKRGAFVLVGVVVLLLGGVGYGLYKFLQQAAPAPFQTTKLTKVTASGWAKVAAISPDAKYVVYAEEDNRQQSLWIRQVATGSSVQIVSAADVAYWGLTFSNDSNYVYYVKNERGGGPFNKLYRVPSLGGASKKLMDHVDSAVSFSPDGRRLAFVRDNLKKEETEIVLANADGGEEQTLAKRKAPERFESDLSTRIGWSPNGKVIACPAMNIDSEGDFYNLVEVSVEDGSEKPVTLQKWAYIGQVAWLANSSGLVMVAADEGSTRASAQLWQLSYSSGETRRITNDLNRYTDVSLTADSNTMATVQKNQVSNIWVAPAGDPNRAKQITSGTNDTKSFVDT